MKDGEVATDRAMNWCKDVCMCTQNSYVYELPRLALSNFEWGP